MTKLLERLFRRENNNRVENDPTEYSGPDTALANYLQYYSTLTSPGYAVLVTGPWGVGKTHQVKQIIQEPARYFVSLYGLDSVSSIHDSVLAACFANLNANKLLETAGEVGKAAGDQFALAGFGASLWNAYLRRRLSPDRTIIFDDLERSPLWENKRGELLGAINHYVEHLGFRVIVICHDELVAANLADVKEKTFGHTVRAAPQTDAAFDAFLLEIRDEPARSFISANRAIVESIWAQSQQSSLRILKHVINDIARLYGVLETRHVKNQDAIAHVLRFFAALNIEVRAGNLSPDLLPNRAMRYVKEEMAREGAEADKPFTKINARYEGSDLTGRILSDEIVVAMLIEGRFDSDSIAAWLDQTPYFIKETDADPWRIVINFDEIEDEPINIGIARMQRQFDERSVSNMGEFLHIAALRLIMAERNASGRSLEEETALCLEYIDDLQAQRRVPEKSTDETPLERLNEAYGGFTYWVTDATRQHFATIQTSINRARQLSLEATYPECASEVLRRLKEDPSTIFEPIAKNETGHRSLTNIPILVHIPAKSFLDVWLGGPRSGWRQVAMALNNRYDFGRLGSVLSAERPWLLDLKREMDARISANAGLDAYRLERIIPQVIKGLLQPDQTE